MILEDLFIQILNKSIAASFVIAAVLLIRLLIRSFPKKYSFLLWLLVGIRLVCPITISSPFSLFQLGQFIESRDSVFPADILSDQSGQTAPADPGKSADTHTGGALPQSQTRQEHEPISESTKTTGTTPVIPAAEEQKNPSPEAKLLSTAAIIWLCGIVLLLLWNLYLVIRTRKRLGRAVLFYSDQLTGMEPALSGCRNIYECDHLASPFVMGLFRPKIYIPFRLLPEEQAYILRHEQYHIRRRDPVTKFLAFLILTIHWFNPLVWTAYLYMEHDMEMSCDEQVLSELGEAVRKDYSRLLLAFASNQRRFSIDMLSFGERNTRRRIKNIMNYKKKGTWMSIAGVAVLLAAAAVCLTNEKSAEAQADRQKTQQSLDAASQEASPLPSQLPNESIPDLPDQPVIDDTVSPQQQTPDYAHMILKIGGIYYFGMAETAAIEDTEAAAGYICSTVSQNIAPHNNAESNFGCIGHPYTSDNGDGHIQVLLEDGEYHTFASDTGAPENAGKHYFYMDGDGRMKVVFNDPEETDPVQLPYNDISTSGRSTHAYEDGTIEMLGYIREFTETDGTVRLLFDYIEWTSDPTEPNGFRIKNPQKEAVSYPVRADAEYQIISNYAQPYGGIPLDGEESGHSWISRESFADYLDDMYARTLVSGDVIDVPSWMWENSTPFWIREKDGVIQLIKEQYVP